MKNLLLIVSFIFLFVSCTEKESITDPKEYSQFLEKTDHKKTSFLQEEIEFWSSKLKESPSQHPYISKLAGAETAMFEASGKIDHLHKATMLLEKANEQTCYENPGFLRGLARNYISQHRFRDALELLKIAEINGEHLYDTEKMLFDVYLELGKDKLAEIYLEKIKDFRKFDYLIRLAKWSDHQGKLNSAIKYMEKALVKAKASKNESLIQWTYSNLADYYGHDNRIKDSYHCYLKALELNPGDTHSKKGIAWITYSYENNPKLALSVLDKITEKVPNPEFFLLKAEIASYNGQQELSNIYKRTYAHFIRSKDYGNMYNKYSVELYTSEKDSLDQALEIARKEIEERPTAQSYDLLAWTYFRQNRFKKAYEIVKNELHGKTSEPHILYHMAEIYNAMGLSKEVSSLKEQLAESSFELGPVISRKIMMF
ncbi:tetratricopeptide repeat protein [Robertkochia solimangrovi]|uniref:tetratricopeptide repeat protein n=1 Tax=Robertkochia solimangrovi TaxID=2213046 RepID=UPI00117CE6E0|nr:cell surface protein [Robertkochia solimangrovi]TRZ45065.1 cell surface protein [Robertkochia solimangrovi]